jgi:hypothetical protein
VDDELVIQFSTAAPDWRPWVPKRLQMPKPLCLLGDKNWASSLIRRTNHSPFSHVDVQLEDGNLLGASDNASAPVVYGNPRGVAVRPPNYQRFAYRRQMKLATPLADDIRKVLLTQVGKGFDNSSLKEFISDKFPGTRNWRLDSHWFCAELIPWAEEVCGYWFPLVQLPWPKNRFSPTDILILHLTDPRWVNRDVFWDPVPGLKLDPGER